MTTAQLNAALKMAQDKSFECIREDGSHVHDTSMFDGFALADFKPIVCTLEQLAAVVRWQCIRMNGTVDSGNLAEIRHVGKQKFTVIGKGA